MIDVAAPLKLKYQSLNRYIFHMDNSGFREWLLR